MRYHERTRRRGVNTPVYWLVRAVLQPFLQVYFRLSRMGRQHIPAKGGVLIAANHRSFLDPFVIGCCLRRPIFFVAKQELFTNRLTGWFLNCLGAFPIRRGESDEESMKTARMLLERGDAVVIFPEGTRHRTGSLGKPKRGVGRLALEAGVPVVPIAVLGSEHARRGWIFRPVKVKLRAGRPLTFPRVDEPSKSLANEVTARIWPCVELQWEWLGGLPPLRKAAVVGAGSAGTAVATLLARAGLDVQLGCRDAGHAERIAAEGQNAAYLPGVELPENVAPTTVAQIEFAGVDLVVFAVPSVVAAAGRRLGRCADRRPERRPGAVEGARRAARHPSDPLHRRPRQRPRNRLPGRPVPRGRGRRTRRARRARIRRHGAARPARQGARAGGPRRRAHR